MDFGRVPDPSSVDFRLPPDVDSSVEAVDSRTTANPRARLGTARWTHPEIVRQLGLRRASLEGYAKQFEAVELNSTFYGVDPDRLKSWRESVPPRFRFLPKVPQEISHVRQLDQCRRPMEKFVDAIRELDDRLGPIALQLPPHFDTSRERRLFEFLNQFSNSIAVELRHESWFSSPSRIADTGERLREAGAIWTLTDVAGRRDVLHMTRTHPTTVVIRFGGCEALDSARLSEWSSRLESWTRDGVREIYFLLHRPEESGVVQLAVDVARKLQAAGITDCRKPAVAPEWEQGELF